MAQTKMIWSSDLYKGFKTNSAQQLKIDDLLPFNFLVEKEKGPDWIRAVADFYETAGWVNVEKKAYGIQRNFDLRYSKLNPSDYIVGPSHYDYYLAAGLDVAIGETSPIQQFYPLVDNIVDLLRGEYVKRDNSMLIEVIDPYSQNELFEKKEKEFEGVMMSYLEKQIQLNLQKSGLAPSQDQNLNQQYEQSYQDAMRQLTEVEMASKKYRTTGQKWAEKVLKVHDQRYNLHELEPDGFESSLISDRCFYHIDLLEDDFKLELINVKWCDYHKGPNVKYVSEGDYFLWFEFMSSGQIIDKFGTRMEEKDIDKLKEVYLKTSNLVVPDGQRAIQGAYYDHSKPWSEATDLNPNMNNALLGKELAYSYMRSPNFDHNEDVDILNPVWGRRVTGKPQMFRVMRLYWKSMRKIGWLTKIDRSGVMSYNDWVDEHFVVTEEPKYDHTLIKEKKKDNLLYGEHIDWTWVPQWRHVIKISPNQKHTFWMNWNETFETIYIDGAPVKFQFKGDKSPYGCLPPVEGAEFSWMNTGPVSLVDRLKPKQILYNICMNKVPKKILEDFGLKLGVHNSLVTNGSTSVQSEVDPLMEFEERLRESPIFNYSTDMDTLRAIGQPPRPELYNMSTVQDAQAYLQLATFVKESAGEDVGITRQRTAKMQASETATGIQQAINYSETQTEKYFENYSNLMTRVRQRMLDAAQFYSTFVPSSRDIYLNEYEENVFLEMDGMQNLLPQYLIKVTSRPNVKEALKQIKQFLFEENTLPIKPSDKIQAFFNNSQARIIELFKEGEAEQVLREDKQREFEQSMQQEKLAQQERLEQDKREREDNNKELDRESNEYIASIRALGGVQTDANVDGTLDAAQNMQILMKQKEMQNKAMQLIDERQSKRQEAIETNLLEREKIAGKLEETRMKTEAQKFVAKENKQKHEVKKRK
jgi:hypothetical protein